MTKMTFYSRHNFSLPTILFQVTKKKKKQKIKKKIKKKKKKIPTFPYAHPEGSDICYNVL
jgi:hypothetical protein